MSLASSEAADVSSGTFLSRIVDDSIISDVAVSSIGLNSVLLTCISVEIVSIFGIIGVWLCFSTISFF